MEEEDYIGWERAKDRVVEDVLRILREQEDLKQETTVRGSLKVNPQLFGEDKHYVLGPIGFQTSFLNDPHFTFGQMPQISREESYGADTSSNIEPFLIQPYVFDLTYEGGAVDGFFIGMYALTEPKSYTTHLVSWSVTGTGTRYKDERIQEAWTTPFDYNEPGYLIDNS